MGTLGHSRRLSRSPEPHNRRCDQQRSIGKPRMTGWRELMKNHATASESKLLPLVEVQQHG